MLSQQVIRRLVAARGYNIVNSCKCGVLYNLRYLSNGDSSNQNEQASTPAVDQETRLREIQRYHKERVEYKKKVRELRKLYAEQYARKTEEKQTRKPKRQRPPSYPPYMLPVIDAFTKEDEKKLEEEQKLRRAEKMRQREEVLQRLKAAEKEKERERDALVKKLQGEAECWFTEFDLADPQAFEAKIESQLSEMVPLQKPFEEHLPKDPYRYVDLFPTVTPFLSPGYFAETEFEKIDKQYAGIKEGERASEDGESQSEVSGRFRSNRRPRGILDTAENTVSSLVEEEEEEEEKEKEKEKKDS